MTTINGSLMDPTDVTGDTLELDTVTTSANGGETQTAPAPPDLEDHSLYFNRELSWLDFNDRVLQLAEDESVPLLERVKFCAIWESNLDEFFMVRVANLEDQLEAGRDARGPDGLSAAEQVAAIHERVIEQRNRASAAFKSLRAELAEHGVRVLPVAEASAEERKELGALFERQVFPVLTPLVIGLGRPFPYISNLSLSLAVRLRDPEQDVEALARVKVPKELLGRFLPLGEGGVTLVPLDDLIAANLEALFPGMEVLSYSFFRVTRDTDYDVSDEADDLLQAVEEELRRRRFGEVVRLEVEAGMDARLRSQLVAAMGLEEREAYEVNGLLDLTDLWDVYGLKGVPSELRDPPHTPVTKPRLLGEDGQDADVFAAMREGDILVHHPYDSFSTSVERFVRQAVADPDVLAIKQTVYRTIRGLAARPVADRGGRARQAGRLHGGAQGAVRRAGEHHLGEEARAGGGARGLRHPGAEDAREVHPRRPPRGRRRAPLRARRHRQLQPEDRPDLHGSRPVHVRPGAGLRHRGDVQLPHGLRPPDRLPQGADRPAQPRRVDPGGDRPHHRVTQPGQPGTDPAEDELPARREDDPGALSRFAGRGAGAS